MQQLQNFHVLHITRSYNRDCQLTIKVYSARFKAAKCFTIEHTELTDIADIITPVLTARGFNIIGKAEAKTGYYLITDTFRSPRNVYFKIGDSVMVGTDALMQEAVISDIVTKSNINTDYIEYTVDGNTLRLSCAEFHKALKTVL